MRSPGVERYMLQKHNSLGIWKSLLSGVEITSCFAHENRWGAYKSLRSSAGCQGALSVRMCRMGAGGKKGFSHGFGKKLVGGARCQGNSLQGFQNKAQGIGREQCLGTLCGLLIGEKITSLRVQHY